MSHQGVEVQCEAIAREDWQTTGRQPLRNLVHELMGKGLRPRSERKGRDDAYAGAPITGDLPPGRFGLSPHLDPQFIQLNKRKVKGTHPTIV